MPVQPDTRRFAIVSDLAGYVPTTQKGAPNGVATLGADGRLTPAQSASAVIGYNPASLSVATAVMTDVPGLAVSLTAGTWAVTVEGIQQPVGGAPTPQLSLVPTGGLVAAASGDAAGSSGTFGITYPPTASSSAAAVASWVAGTGLVNVLIGGTSGTNSFPFRVAGVLVVTTAGGIKAQFRSSTSSTTSKLLTGAVFRAEKLA